MDEAGPANSDGHNGTDEDGSGKSDGDNVTDEARAAKSNAALDSDHTVGYIVSMDENTDDFDSSDEEPLSKYVVKCSRSPDFNLQPIPVTPGQPTAGTSHEQ